MRVLVVKNALSIVRAIASIGSLDLAGLADKIADLVKFAATIVEAVVDVQAAFESWRIKSKGFIDALDGAMADQTGTDGGWWPDFVRA
jgi:hypothetical protein